MKHKWKWLCAPGSRLAVLAEEWGKAMGFSSDDWSRTDLTDFGSMALLDFVRRCGLSAELKAAAMEYIAGPAKRRRVRKG